MCDLKKAFQIGSSINMKVNLVNRSFLEDIFCLVLSIEFSLNFMSPVYMNSITFLIFYLFLPNKSSILRQFSKSDRQTECFSTSITSLSWLALAPGQAELKNFSKVLPNLEDKSSLM